jgi:predicted nucleic acid-binding protein
MIVYLDTSALVPMFIEEPTTAACRRIWDEADTIASTRLLFIEASAALARSLRSGRTGVSSFRSRSAMLDSLWDQVRIMELDQNLMERAAAVTNQFPLRGFDAVHCAAGSLIGDDNAVRVSADNSLLGAWTDLGLSTFDPNRN